MIKKMYVIPRWRHTGGYQVVYRLCLLNNPRANDRLHIYPLIGCLIPLTNETERKESMQDKWVNQITSGLFKYYIIIFIPLQPQAVTLHNAGLHTFAKQAGTPLMLHNTCKAPKEHWLPAFGKHMPGEMQFLLTEKNPLINVSKKPGDHRHISPFLQWN